MLNPEWGLKKIECPYCGYKMPIFYYSNVARCEGLMVKCKGSKCRMWFEIKI